MNICCHSFTSSALGGQAMTMFLITVVGFAVIACAVWTLGRIVRYTFGEYSDKIHVPVFIYALVILSIFSSYVPLITLIVFGYILFFCKSVPRLMSVRDYLIGEAHGEEVVESVEKLILENNLSGDEWVVNVWGKKSKDQWATELDSNLELLREVLSRTMKVHCRSGVPYADWTEVIKQFQFLQQQSLMEPSALGV